MMDLILDIGAVVMYAATIVFSLVIANRIRREP